MADSFIERNGSLFQILATVIVAAVAGIGGWWLRNREQDTKTFDYRRSDDVAVVTSDKRPERLKIMFGPVEVTNPFISQIRFKNTGQRVIEVEDFLEPVTITRPGAKILDFNIVSQSEKHLVDRINQVAPTDGQTEHEVVLIEPRTLNPGDSFVAQIVYDGDHSREPIVTCRINGQTRRMEIYPTRQEIGYTKMFWPLLPTVLLLVAFGVSNVISRHAWTRDGIVFIAMGIAIQAFGIWTTIYRRRKLRARLTAEQPRSG